MKSFVLTAVAAMFASAASAQTAPQTPTEERGAALTRDLNSGPPVPATYLAPAPAATSPATTTAPAASRPAPVATPAATTTPARPTTPPPTGAEPATVTTPAPRPTPPAASPPTVTTTPAPAPRTNTAAPPPTPAPTTSSPTTAAPAATAVPAAATVEPAPPPPNVPTVTVLDASARAALPFSIDLPQGFELVTGRPGPNFRIYTIRRRADERSFVMIYAGPTSQFPIYSGEQVEAGGRTSVVATDADGSRRAVEHMFERATAPTEVHIWIMSVDGADRAVAERIAQAVDAR